ncbi:MAG: PAS domain S-box protein [Nitrospiraceae bacterium]|nr:PAS domain S-box protein [Nitrospiraceae bacterium]
MIENLSLPAFVLNTRHEVVIWNKACEELTGVKSADIQGTQDHWKPFYPEKIQTLADVVIDGNYEDLSKLYAVCSEPKLVKNGLESEGWFRNLGGNDRYIIFSASPVYDSRGDLVFAIQTLQDITGRKKLEEALKESEGRLRTMIESEPQCVKLLDPDGALLAMNPSGLAMIEADSFEQVKGKSVCGLVLPEYRKSFNELVKKVFSGEPASLEFEIAGLKGTIRRLSTQAVPFKDINGRITGLLSITTDITRQRRLEEELRQAQKMEAVGQLAGGIAHDFNNILSAIIGYADLLESKVRENAPLKNYADHILSASQKAVKLVKSLLAFSRKQTISLAPVELNALIRGLEKLLSRLIREDIELVIRGGEDLIVMADSGQIEQVLMNLVTNAKDAMPGGGFLVIQTGVSEIKDKFIGNSEFTPGRYAHISVTDTGTGMDAQTAKRIFDPFFTTKEVGKGTGLGLSVTYGIIEQHGGRIEVRSETEVGTNFDIYLPLYHPLPGISKNEKQNDAMHPNHLLEGSETILVAEDDLSLRTLTSAMLREHGYTVIEAGNGEEAVEKFMEHRNEIRLAVLDVIMPRKNGKEACDQIKKIAPGTKTIFMSGYTSDIINGNGLEETAINFIQKPITPKALLSKVRQTLDGHPIP